MSQKPRAKRRKLARRMRKTQLDVLLTKRSDAMFPEKAIRVAVLDLSDPDGLVEVVARAWTETGMWKDSSEEYKQTLRNAARAALSALGVLGKEVKESDHEKREVHAHHRRPAGLLSTGRANLLFGNDDPDSFGRLA